MVNKQKVEKQSIKIIELLKPALRQKAGKYQTSWGNKTEQGLKASIISLIADVEGKRR